MFAINMARKPELTSLWVGFAHSAISRVSSKDQKNFHWEVPLETSNIQLYKRL